MSVWPGVGTLVTSLEVTGCDEIRKETVGLAAELPKEAEGS